MFNLLKIALLFVLVKEIIVLLLYQIKPFICCYTEILSPGDIEWIMEKMVQNLVKANFLIAVQQQLLICVDQNTAIKEHYRICALVIAS